MTTANVILGIAVVLGLASDLVLEDYYLVKTPITQWLWGGLKSKSCRFDLYPLRQIVIGNRYKSYFVPK